MGRSLQQARASTRALNRLMVVDPVTAGVEGLLHRERAHLLK